TDRFGASEDRAPTGAADSDLLAALMAWVERGQAPARIVARRADVTGATDRTRPLCPFPQQARYLGRGDAGDAANFACGDPAPPLSTSNPAPSQTAARTTSPGSIQ